MGVLFCRTQILLNSLKEASYIRTVDLSLGWASPVTGDSPQDECYLQTSSKIGRGDPLMLTMKCIEAKMLVSTTMVRAFVAITRNDDMCEGK